MASIESTVTVFCNSVLGARSNRDGFFAVYAGIAGRYPRFGYHLDANRRGTHRVRVEAALEARQRLQRARLPRRRLVGEGVPVFEGFTRRPSLDELDALGAALATSGGVALFILPGVTPPFASLSRRSPLVPVSRSSRGAADLEAVYDEFTTGDGRFDLVHLGCPHASFEEMKHYAPLLDGKGSRTTSSSGSPPAARCARWRRTPGSWRRSARRRQGDLGHLPDVLPFRPHHLARSGARRRAADLARDRGRQRQAGPYVRDMIHCDTLLTGTEQAIASALSGEFTPRFGGQR